MRLNSKSLFTERATDYAQSRPGYPHQVFSLLRPTVEQAVAADVGAGTGIFSRGLLAMGYKVFAVEPNQAMREQATESMNHDPKFKAIAGQGEHSGLDSRSVDLVTIAQAFHWLDRPKAREEFIRIGNSGFRVAVVWNSRTFDANDFMKAYRQMLLDFCPSYAEMKSTYWNDLHEDVRQFFAGGSYEQSKFPNTQLVTQEHFIGNLLSLSYAPKKGDANHEKLIRHAEELFQTFQEDESVPFALETHCYVGHLS